MTTDLPITVRSSHHHNMTAKMIELSAEGVRFLCPVAPKINSRLELIFTLPSEEVAPELRIMSNVRHIFIVHDAPGTPPDYRYVVGAAFATLDKNERVLLDKYALESCVHELVVQRTLANSAGSIVLK